MHSLAPTPNELNQLKTYISFREKWLAEPAQRLRDVEMEKMAMRDHIERLLGEAERLREAENRLREMGMHLKAEELRRASDGGKKVRFCNVKGEDGE